MLSVLIVNWNTKDLLIACLESLFVHPPEEEMEVIVVDNASTDGSAEAVRSWASGLGHQAPGIGCQAPEAGHQAAGRDAWRPTPEASLRLIQSKSNLGYAAGNNLACEHASGEWLLTLNPDTEVFEGTLQTAIDTLKRRPRDGALGAKLVSPDGTVQKSVRGFPSLLGILGALLRIKRLDTYSLPEFDYETEQLAPQPMGTFLMFRREALEEAIWHPSGVRRIGVAEPRVEPELDPGLPSSMPPGSASHVPPTRNAERPQPSPSAPEEIDAIREAGELAPPSKEEAERLPEGEREGSRRLSASDASGPRRGEPSTPKGVQQLTDQRMLRPFDESFPIFFNEVDLLKRLKDKGWGCVYDPAVRVLHHGGESTKQVRPKMIWESHRSLIRYLKKHSLRWWNAPLMALVAIAVWLGALVRARRYDVGFRP